MCSPRCLVPAALGLFVTACLALAADEATQTVDASGLTFQAPASWKKGPAPSSPMAPVATLRVDPAEGDADPAELRVYHFPRGAGTVEENVRRWQGFFVDDQGQAPKATTEQRKGKNVDVTVVELAGRYVASVRPGSPEKHNKPNYRMLGAIIQPASGGAYFLRMVGPDKTMKSIRPAFDELIKSTSVGGK